MLPALFDSPSQGHADLLRYLVSVDLNQTEHFVKRNNVGVYEQNPLYKNTTPWQTALLMLAGTEGAIWGSRQINPKRPHDLTKAIALGQALTVLSNASKGARTPFYIPLVSKRF